LATLAAPGISATARSRVDVSDHDLVQAVRAGDDHAFERLYHRYHRRIAAYVFGMVRDHGRAEDLTQEVFVAALRRMRQTDRPIAFKPWIYEIAKNASIDAFRRSSRAEEVSFDAEEGLGAGDYGKLASTGPTPDAALDDKQSLDHLCGAFGGLSEAHHQILVMRELEGLSYREIGERLGMSRPSVESTLFRARRRLAEEYEELVTGERCLRIQSIISGVAARSALGVRDQRRVGSHISYCQPCRKQAIVAGLDAAAMARRPVRAQIAAFLPLPGFLRRRWLPGGGTDGATAQAAQHGPSLAQLSMAAAQYGEPTMAGWMKATAVATAVAVAGVGVGAAGHAARHGAPAAQGTPIVQRTAQAGAGRSAPATAPASAQATPGLAAAGGRSVARAAPAGAVGRSVTGTPSVAGGGPAGTPAPGSGSGTPSAGGAPAPRGGGAAGGSSDSSASTKPATLKTPPVGVPGPGTATGAVEQAVTGTAGAAGSAPAAAGSPAPLVQPDLTPLTQAPASAAPPSSAGQVVQNTTDVVGGVVGGQVGSAVKDTGAAAGRAVDQVTGAVGGVVGGALGGK
jgi:RNA polymerase sigma factor (sigma-70 family)